MTACCFSPAPFVATAQKTPHVTCLKCGTFNFWHMKCSDWPRFWAGKSWLHSPGLGSPTHSTRSSRLKNSPDRPSRLPSGPSSKCSSLRWFESYPNFMGFLAYLASSQRYAWSFNMMIVHSMRGCRQESGDCQSPFCQPSRQNDGFLAQYKWIRLREESTGNYLPIPGNLMKFRVSTCFHHKCSLQPIPGSTQGSGPAHWSSGRSSPFCSQRRTSSCNQA